VVGRLGSLASFGDNIRDDNLDMRINAFVMHGTTAVCGPHARFLGRRGSPRRHTGCRALGGEECVEELRVPQQVQVADVVGTDVLVGGVAHPVGDPR